MTWKTSGRQLRSKKIGASLPFQPPVLQKLKKEDRNFSIDEKRQVIDAVLGGLSVGYVSRKMGSKRQAVAKWVKEFRKTGQIKGRQSSSLMGNICSIVEQDPRRSVSKILRIVNKADIGVSFCALNTFLKNRGYARDAEGRLGRHD
jgi:transposase-like protein